jgi:hypothetical protein
MFNSTHASISAFGLSFIWIYSPDLGQVDSQLLRNGILSHITTSGQSGETALVRLAGYVPLTGVPGCSMLEVNEAGLLARYWIYCDPAPLAAVVKQ